MNPNTILIQTLTTRREEGYPEALSKHKSGHPHPSDHAEFFMPVNIWHKIKPASVYDGSRAPNKIPKGNKRRRLEAVVEARLPTTEDVMQTKLLGVEMTNLSQVAPATTFSFDSHTVRVIADAGHPLFVAKDVAQALGYSRPNDAIQQHCKGAVKRRPLQTEGGIQEVRVIEEPDVYRLIFGSKLESAQKFQDWVFEEVLPAIRKTGKYETKARAPKTRKTLAGGLTLEQQDTIKALHRELVKAAPEHLQAKLAVTLWSAIKSKFGVTYKAVPPEHYPEILSLMGRVAQELPQQALPKPTPAHIIRMEFDTREEGYYHITIADGKAYRQRIMYASTAGDPYSPHNQHRH